MLGSFSESKGFEFMCDASDYAVGVVLGQQRDKIFHAIYCDGKVLNDTQLNYAITEKEMLTIVYALEKFRSYLVGSRVINFIDHATKISSHKGRFETNAY